MTIFKPGIGGTENLGNICLTLVAVGEIEMNQEYNLMPWSAEDVENKLQDTMKQTFERTIKAANDYGFLNKNPEVLVHGGNICAFLNLAQAMGDQG